MADRPGGNDADNNKDADNKDAGEPSVLGAAAPQIVGREPRAPRNGERRLKPPKLGLWTVVVVVVLILLAFVPAFIGGLKKTPRDRVGISYGGGPIEGVHYQRIVQPGSSLFFNGFFDPLYLYPSDQVNYIISQAQGQGAQQSADSVVAPTKDRVQVTYQLAVYFKLDTDRLRAFHEEFGLRYKAYTSAGWFNLIRDTFRQQIENSLQEETRRYNVADLFSNADVLVSVQNSVQKKLSQRLKDAMGEQFFCSPTFEPGKKCDDPTLVIKKVDVPPSVAQAFQDNRTSGIQILTKQNEIAQRQAEAQSIAALGLTGDQYDMLKAIESGKINFWVLPNNGGVTITGPSPGGGGGSSSPPTTSTTKPRAGGG